MQKLNSLLILFLIIFSLKVDAQQSNNFEIDNGLPITIDTINPNNIWQIGQPLKTIFSSSLSLPNALNLK